MKNILDLPTELLLIIARILKGKDVKNLRLTCSAFREIIISRADCGAVFTYSLEEVQAAMLVFARLGLNRYKYQTQRGKKLCLSDPPSAIKFLIDGLPDPSPDSRLQQSKWSPKIAVHNLSMKDLESLDHVSVDSNGDVWFDKDKDLMNQLIQNKLDVVGAIEKLFQLDKRQYTQTCLTLVREIEITDIDPTRKDKLDVLQNALS